MCNPHFVELFLAPGCALRFRACCHRALEGALNLVSTCSGIPSKQLEQVYRELCSETAGESFFELSHDMDYDEEMEDLEICLDQPPADCMGFLTQLQDETKLLKGEDDEKIPTRQDDKMPDLRHVPDSELLREVLSASSATDPFRMENSCSPKKRKDLNTLPTTLLEALSLGQRGCVFNSLFRLAVFLRSGVGGSDCGWLQNPKNCRRASKKLNWHQLPGSNSLPFLMFLCEIMCRGHTCHTFCSQCNVYPHFIDIGYENNLLSSSFLIRTVMNCLFMFISFVSF